MAALCTAGGLFGFYRTRSMPSLLAGIGVGSLYGVSGYKIYTGQDNGFEATAGILYVLLVDWYSSLLTWQMPILAASAILLLASAPRARKGRVPLALTDTSAITGAYYGIKVYDWRT